MGKIWSALDYKMYRSEEKEERKREKNWELDRDRRTDVASEREREMIISEVFVVALRCMCELGRVENELIDVS